MSKSQAPDTERPWPAETVPPELGTAAYALAAQASVVENAKPRAHPLAHTGQASLLPGLKSHARCGKPGAPSTFTLTSALLLLKQDRRGMGARRAVSCRGQKQPGPLGVGF